VIAEAELAQIEHGLVATGEGWYVVNARDTRWYYAEGRGAFCELEGDQHFRELGINIMVLAPGEAMAMYHWEADQEDFLVVSGEALLVVEGEERALRAWDFVHCPPMTRHTILGAGDGPCVVVAVGGREHAEDSDWGGYPVDEVAGRHGTSVEQETSIPDEAYAAVRARYGLREQTAYRDGWLP
jgi:uncharacterized cupin superfamily protein